MVPMIFLLAVATTGNANLIVATSIGVPIVYALAAGLLDFVFKWSFKGRSRYPLRIWTDEGNNRGWQPQPGDVEKLVALHRNYNITHVERTVRLSEGNPYSLGLGLTVGAFAIDVASYIGGEGEPVYLATAVFLQVLVFIVVIVLMLLNQSSRPDEIWWQRSTAFGTILAGIVAMFLSFLTLDAGVVTTVLNTTGIGGG